MDTNAGDKTNRRWREILFEIIFEADTPAGKWFDIALIICISLSVLTVMLDSVSSIRAGFGRFLYAAEWFFTILFTIEYILRLLCVRKPTRYAVSFFGIVDLLAILPTYTSLLFFGSRHLAVVRILRVLLTLVVIIGSAIYIIEGEENGFTSIPRSVYWAVVTLTTVGYGDISPNTGPGQFLAAIVMILGYSIIAVPTGIVTVELSQAYTDKSTSQACPNCSAEGHDRDAEYCKFCGAKL
ncbi:MAG: ion transporter [Planctomycetota bacterium]